MWPIIGILLIALFIGAAIVAPWMDAEEKIKDGNWLHAVWIALCAAGVLCYWFTGLVWVNYITIGVILIGLKIFKKKNHRHRAIRNDKEL